MPIEKILLIFWKFCRKGLKKPSRSYIIKRQEILRESRIISKWLEKWKKRNK